MTKLTDDEIDELRQLAARMYRMVEDVEDIRECLEPSGDEEACPPSGCKDCGWCANPLRDALIRLGVDV